LFLKTARECWTGERHTPTEDRRSCRVGQKASKEKIEASCRVGQKAVELRSGKTKAAEEVRVIIMIACRKTHQRGNKQASSSSDGLTARCRQAGPQKKFVLNGGD
jgi:hypothetical protein